MNYFALVITNEEEDAESIDSDEREGKIPNSHYLKPLFHACGQFLSNPLSHRNRKDKYTFSIRVINSIRDGVRLLLQQTDCLSRSNEIVTKRPVVRRSRKSLLADWYNLMVKANEFKGTSNFNKIEILTLMVYQVTRKALDFLEIWSNESKEIVTRDNDRKLYDDLNNYPLLTKPPYAKQRITEINGILYSYLGLIIGRLDLIEHNQIGCDILETLAHQIILLLRELLFISRTGSDFSTSSEKPHDLDSSLDGLLSLVSDLVASVKNLVVKTINETEDDKIYNFGSPQLNGARDYYYTQEGGELIQISSKMIKAISITISSIRKLLDATGDFRLAAERSYPDYTKIRIEPTEFIKKCSKGINVQFAQPPVMEGVKSYKANRYSMVRSGKTGDLGFTDSGVDFLSSLNNNNNNSSPFTMSAAEFEPFTTSTDAADKYTNIKDELLVDGNGNLLGGSFKGLVYTLTNEDSPPEYFFISTFFICFRSFSNGIDLIEELIVRFEVGVTPDDINVDLKLKKRRKLIVQMFQLWMESYWNFEADYNLLTTLINFFNEGMSIYLPLDANRLIEIGAKLSSRPLIENRSKKCKSGKQLVDRTITVNNSHTDVSRFSSMIDINELSRINSNSSATSSARSESLIPTVDNSTSLVSPTQLQTIEKINLTYRAILGNSWCSSKYIDTSRYLPIDLSVMMPNFYIICDQSWVLSNYRPNLLDFNGLEIAKQLTLLESHIFCSIKSNELLNQNYTTKKAHLKLAPNVRQSLLFTNCLSGYVLESILQPNLTHKLRMNTIKTWLKVAISCLYLRNFNSLAAIITALESHLITRLSSIWFDLESKYTELYDYLSSIIHPEKNYTIYRNKLKNFLNLDNHSVPIVPYFSLFLQDLTFVNDGNPKYRKANGFLNQKVINIDKYLKITRIIADIECLQIPYLNDNDGPESIKPVSGLQELILLELWKICQLNKTEEDRAWKLSCEIQPR
ncbi:BUD5 Bud site selection protein 5 [Candida maltosa Xu316]